MPILNCLPTYNQDISGCVEELVITNSTLVAGTDYIVKMTYPNGWVVKRTLTANDYDGTLVVANSNYWHVGTGPVVVEVYSASDNSCTPIDFTICTFTYSSITVNFINITQDDYTYATIPCDCPE
jgi:hypothetical protein